MTYSTTNTYKMKREILNFVDKISANTYRPYKKFMADIIYGMLASGSCLLTEIAQELCEDSKKINVVDRLSRHLAEDDFRLAQNNYLESICKMVPDHPVIHIDDSDVVKPEGHHFESLGWVRDGSKSTKDKTVISKGYHVTEACVLTKTGHPVSFFSELHSSLEKSFTSINHVTFAAMERGRDLFSKATYIMDRGYDDNKMFCKLMELGQDFVIRLTNRRKLYYKNKWVWATELCEKRKGKVKMNLFYKGKNHSAYLSHVKTLITASKVPVYLVLVYGISEHPMMLATNKVIRSKEDLMSIAKLYFSRWRIEEYFRCKKQMFDFENFRVRSLKAINALNFCLSICMAFLGNMEGKSPTNKLRNTIIEAADPIKKKVHFQYYRIASGIAELLKHAKEGVHLWFKTLRPDQRQLRIKFA